MSKAQPPALAKQPEDRGLTVYRSRDGQEVRLSFAVVRRYLVSGHPEYVRDEEIMLYMGMCKARGLNPFKKDCYLVKYTEGDPAATIVSIDYYRARARAQDDCRGWKCGVIVAPKDKDDIVDFVERDGSFILDDEKVVGGWFRAKPAGWDEEIHWTVPLNRYVKKTRDGKPTQFWQEEKQAEMICKVAESQGLRRVWPDEFGKLYVKEEIVEGLAFDRSPIPPPREIEDNEDQKGKPGNPDPNGSGKGSTDSGLRNDTGGVGQSSGPARKGAKKEKPPEEMTAADRLTMWLDMCDAGGHDAEIFSVQNEFAKHINEVPSSEQIPLIKRYQEVRKNALPRWEQAKKDRANAEG